MAVPNEMNSDKWSVEAPWMLRGKEYSISADVKENVLIVQVEEQLTADRWRGQFEAKRKLHP